VPTANELRPVGPSARLLHLDVLRGLSLFGVLIVNLDVFSGAMWATEAKLPYPQGWGGATLSFLQQTLLEGKAASLLGMLFGVGLAIQLGEAERKGHAYLPFALRRIGALALLGLAHSVFLWNFDILLDYALISLMVLPFLRLSAARILWAIPVLLAVSVAIAVPLLPRLERIETQALWFYEMGLAHYGGGSWREALRFRTSELVEFVGPLRLTSRLPALLPFFILGVYAWKKGILAEPERHLRTLRTLCLVCLPLGLVFNLFPPHVLHPWVAEIPFQPLRVLIKATAFFARPAVILGYVAAVLLLLQRPWWHAQLGRLAPLGRLALSQYLLQSIVFTWVFNGYGFGLYGTVPVSLYIAGGIVFFGLQVWSSRLWIARFPVGPAEWLWRRMVYPRRDPPGVPTRA
jgi:uncharacterized protein